MRYSCWDWGEAPADVIMPTTKEIIREQFIRMASGPEESIDLIEAALLIARTAFPDLIASTHRQLLDGWSGQLRKRAGPSASAGEIVSGLNQILFEREGLRGDAQNYYDPQNSFLNRVLERKKGIPIWKPDIVTITK